MSDITSQVEKVLSTTKVIPLHTHNNIDSHAIKLTDTIQPLIHNIQTYTPIAGGIVNLALGSSNVHHITMPAGNITIAVSQSSPGQCFIVRILQDSVGNRTVTWFNTISWAGGSAPTLTTIANKADTFGFETTAVNTYDGFIIGQNI